MSQCSNYKQNTYYTNPNCFILTFHKAKRWLRLCSKSVISTSITFTSSKTLKCSLTNKRLLAALAYPQPPQQMDPPDVLVNHPLYHHDNKYFTSGDPPPPSSASDCGSDSDRASQLNAESRKIKTPVFVDMFRDHNTQVMSAFVESKRDE